MAIQPSWESLNDTITALKARVRDLESATRPGLAAVSGELTVDFGKHAFGTKAANTQPDLNFGPGFGLSAYAWHAAAPDINQVLVQSGNLFVQVSSHLYFRDGDADASLYHGWNLTGPLVPNPPDPESTTITYAPFVLGPDGVRSLRLEHKATNVAQGATVSYGYLHTGLPPGYYNVQSRYYFACPTVGAGQTQTTAVATYRNILAIPF